ncbi:MAG TPA: CAP domain-containing protein [Arachidicoccus sp.]
MPKVYFALMSVLMFFVLSPTTAQKHNRDSFEEQILYCTNKFRAKHDLAPVKMDSYINSEAAKHSRDMASGRAGFGHGGFQQRTDNLRNKLGAVAAGENVAYGLLSAKEVVDIWINSAPHRKNLLGNFTMAGIGVAKNEQGILFFTQIFAR